MSEDMKRRICSGILATAGSRIFCIPVYLKIQRVGHKIIRFFLSCVGMQLGVSH